MTGDIAIAPARLFVFTLILVGLTGAVNLYQLCF